MFPMIPLLAILAIVGGGTTLLWYEKLSEKQKQDADRLACDYAQQLFNKSLEELTKAEAKHVAMLTQRHFQK